MGCFPGWRFIMILGVSFGFSVSAMGLWLFSRLRRLVCNKHCCALEGIPKAGYDGERDRYGVFFFWSIICIRSIYYVFTLITFVYYSVLGSKIELLGIMATNTGTL